MDYTKQKISKGVSRGSNESAFLAKYSILDLFTNSDNSERAPSGCSWKNGTSQYHRLDGNPNYTTHTGAHNNTNSHRLDCTTKYRAHTHPSTLIQING